MCKYFQNDQNVETKSISIYRCWWWNQYRASFLYLVTGSRRYLRDKLWIENQNYAAVWSFSYLASALTVWGMIQKRGGLVQQLESSSLCPAAVVQELDPFSKFQLQLQADSNSIITSINIITPTIEQEEQLTAPKSAHFVSLCHFPPTKGGSTTIE